MKIYWQFAVFLIRLNFFYASLYPGNLRGQSRFCAHLLQELHKHALVAQGSSNARTLLSLREALAVFWPVIHGYEVFEAQCGVSLVPSISECFLGLQAKWCHEMSDFCPSRKVVECACCVSQQLYGFGLNNWTGLDGDWTSINWLYVIWFRINVIYVFWLRTESGNDSKRKTCQRHQVWFRVL